VVTGTIYFAVNNEYTYLIWMCVSIWLEGGHFTLFPTVCGKLFGVHGPTTYSIGFFCFGSAALSGIFMEKVILRDVQKNFYIFIIICLAMQITALVLNWTLF
jgi:hypothetical protein